MARKAIIIGMIVLAFTPQLEGVELGLNLYGVCKHLNQLQMSYQPKLNESNPGLGLTMNFVHVKHAVVFMEAGFFEDSFKNTATYVSAPEKVGLSEILVIGEDSDLRGRRKRGFGDASQIGQKEAPSGASADCSHNRSKWR